MIYKISLPILLMLVISACNSAAPGDIGNKQSKSQVVTVSGVKLWVENCARCHVIRPPESYSDAQWDIAVLHMRVRANLTANEASAIVKYLKAAN